MSAPITTTDVTAGDTVLRVCQTGADHPDTIVFLHGSGPGANALSNWEWVISELGDTYHCVAPDIAGFGDSTHPDPPPVGIDAFAAYRVESLMALLGALDLQRVTLVGNSMGGMFSMLIAQRAPELVERLILMGSAGGKADILPGLFTMIGFYDDPTADAMEQLLRLFLHDPSIFGDDLAKIAADRLPNAVRPEVERSHRATFDFSVPPTGFTDEDFASITTPTLLLHGDDDQIVSIESSRDLAQRLPSAHLEVFPDAGHWLQIERGPEFVASVRRFMQGD